jgi:hypothetical protein
LDVAEVDAGVEHRGDVAVSEHVRMDQRHPHPGRLGEGLQSPGSSVPVHARVAGVEQDRTGDPITDRPVESATDRRRQRDEDRLAALA